MQDSLLVRLLYSLNKDQIKELEKFLRSPYHNTSTTLLKLFRYLKKFHPEMEGARLSKQYTFNAVFPDETYDDRKMRKQMSLLKSAIENFITHEMLKQKPNIQYRFLIDHYYRIETYAQIAKRIKNRIKKLESQKERDAAFYLEMVWLYEKLFYHPKNGTYKRAKSKTIRPDLNEQLDLFYILSKLRLKTDFNIRKRVVREDIPAFIPFEAIRESVKNAADENALIWLYLQLDEFQQEKVKPFPEDFERCISIFKDHLGLMGWKERGFILNVLINIAIARQNIGDEVFLAYAAQLFQLADSMDLMLHDGQVQSYAFLNATFIGSGAHEFGWVADFIDRYQGFLAEEKQDIVVDLSWAAWYYHHSKLPNLYEDKKMDYLKKALEYVHNLAYSEFAFDVRIRSLQLRIYYDLYIPEGNKRVFDDFAKAFNKYLNEKSDQYEEKVKAYKLFIRYTKKLARLYHKYFLKNTLERVSVEMVEEQIRKTPKVALKIWLLGVVKELHSLTTD